MQQHISLASGTKQRERHTLMTTLYSTQTLQTREPSPWVLSPALAFRNERTQSDRFVAGTTFFHYDAYGSLRPDKEPIQLVSRHCIGLGVHVLACGFSFYFMSYGYGRVLAEYLRANDDQQANAANYMLVWPTCLSLLFGLASDSLPLCGYRRKAYMILGWGMSLAMYVVLFILDAFSDSGRVLYDDNTASGGSPFPVAYIIVSLLASCGIQIAWVSSMAAGVEYAQREHIHHRGRLQGSLIALYNFGGVLAQSLTAYIISEGSIKDHYISKISIGGAAAILAGVALATTPFVLFFFHEEPMTTQVHVAIREPVRTFWKFCHQNAVYRVLFFITLHLFCIGIFNQNVRDAVRIWSNVSRKASLVVDAVRITMMTLSVVMWRNYLRNANWRTLSYVGSTIFILALVFQTVFVTYGVIRSEWFYALTYAVSEIPRAWLLILSVVLSTEIAAVGHEGITLGLALSYQRLVALADFTLAAIFPKVIGLQVTDEDVKSDSSASRSKVITAFAIITAINLLCLFVIRLVPQQKLDAQQLRAYGGYNRYASVALLVIFAVLICFNLVANVIAVL